MHYNITQVNDEQQKYQKKTIFANTSSSNGVHDTSLYFTETAFKHTTATLMGEATRKHTQTGAN